MGKEINLIKERNRRVETDKAWETSNTKRAIITVMTYIVIVIFLFIINAPSPWLTALVPTIGYLLSTLTMPLFKKLWIKSINKK
ncbi:MAG: hypothetical protein IIC69_02155 [Nanoarchaeota archaeon]|nr:hypothetical protein [Nanoarchaeota archaeon]